MVGLFVLPPAGACFWWVMVRGAAKSFEGDVVSLRTRRRQKIGFFLILIGSYIVVIGILIYVLVK